jgi:hypothetical protein
LRFARFAFFILACAAWQLHAWATDAGDRGNRAGDECDAMFGRGKYLADGQISPQYLGCSGREYTAAGQPTMIPHSPPAQIVLQRNVELAESEIAMLAQGRVFLYLSS